MPKTNEIALNGQIAEVLRHKHPLWREHLYVEQTGLIATNRSLQPDILISAPQCQPVTVETEYKPASTVETDAISRLGLKPTSSSNVIEQSIAVRLPVTLQSSQIGFHEAISLARFEYCIYSGSPSDPNRFPLNGWLAGGIDDIVHCIEYALVSPRLIDESTRIFESGIESSTQCLQQIGRHHFQSTEQKFAEILNQSEGEQTNRMAMTIIANALTFYQSIAGKHRLPGIAEIREASPQSLQKAFQSLWRKVIEEINYWPILKVARDLLVTIDWVVAQEVLDRLIDAAFQLALLGITSRHDLAGRIFQKLIIDRKYLATFYTQPTSATLLAEIAFSKLDKDWDELDKYPDLRIADFSCGTGTLLSAAYNSVLRRYRQAGGDDQEIHNRMIEQAIVAADIMPAATHLCASQLSSAHPSVPFSNTRVYTMPYGTADENAPYRDTAIGSLDLIDADRAPSLFATGQTQIQGLNGGKEVAHISVPNESVDLVIMNPPFTRPTNHRVSDAPVPSFAGFQTSEEEQKVMSAQLARIRRGLEHPAGHGNAGLASNFIDLAHAKVKPGGVIALVLPIAVVLGGSWRAARSLLLREYSNVVVVTIAKAGSMDRAFSADTSMAEALLIANRKTGKTESVEDQYATFVNLLNRPNSLIESAELAKLVRDLPEKELVGFLYLGEQIVGNYIRAPLSEGGCAALCDTSIASTLMTLPSGKLAMARLRSAVQLPITKLNDIGSRGLYHLDIGNWNEGEPPFRGPFKLTAIQNSASYPILASHNARQERNLFVNADSEGIVRRGCDERAVDVWQTATRLHYTQDFGLNAQSISACLTPEKSLGGRAWPNFKPTQESWEELLVLWSNSTLGLMSFWWAGSRQHDGRSILTITRLLDLPTIDPRELSERQIQQAKEAFEEFQNRPLLPANEAYRDETRQAIDEFLLIDMLGLSRKLLEPLSNLRLRWCSEPSVHGNKRTAPTQAI